MPFRFETSELRRCLLLSCAEDATSTAFLGIQWLSQTRNWTAVTRSFLLELSKVGLYYLHSSNGNVVSGEVGSFHPKRPAAILIYLSKVMPGYALGYLGNRNGNLTLHRSTET